MSLKELPTGPCGQSDINSQTVIHFTKLLSNNKNALVNDNKVQKALLNLKKLLFELEDQLVDSRSKLASKKLSRMTEEGRKKNVIYAT